MIVILLAGYFLMLLLGTVSRNRKTTSLPLSTRRFLVNHMYKDVDPAGNPIAFDPEGLLSTLPSIAHVLIGFLFGKLIVENKDNHIR